MEMTENEQAKHGHGVIIWNILHRQLTFSTEQLQQTTEVAAVSVVPKKGLLLVIVSKDSVKAMNTINSHDFHNTSNHTRLVITTTWSKAFYCKPISKTYHSWAFHRSEYCSTVQCHAKF